MLGQPANPRSTMHWKKSCSAAGRITCTVFTSEGFRQTSKPDSETWMEEEEPRVHPIESPRLKNPQQFALTQYYPRKTLLRSSSTVQTTHTILIPNHLCRRVHGLGWQGNKVMSEQKKGIVKGKFSTHQEQTIWAIIELQGCCFIRPLEAILPNNSDASELFPSIKARENNQATLQKHWKSSSTPPSCPSSHPLLQWGFFFSGCTFYINFFGAIPPWLHLLKHCKSDFRLVISPLTSYIKDAF